MAQITLTGPLFERGGAGLSQDFQTLFMQNWYDLLVPIAGGQLRASTPVMSGALRRSLYINLHQSDSGSYIEFGYRRPAGWRWHFAGRGTWPAQHDQIILDAALKTVQVALDRTIAQLSGG